jgi:hypothetical protein
VCHWGIKCRGRNRCWYRYLIKTVVVTINVFYFFYSNRIFIDLVAPATIVTKIQTDAKPILTIGSELG